VPGENFSAALTTIRSEGRYRVFTDVRRPCGDFPRVLYTAPCGVPMTISEWASILFWHSRATSYLS
jgi:hypothetical protein